MDSMVITAQSLDWFMVYDKFFPTHLQVFYCLVRDYIISFRLNLKQRRDRGFHVYRELSQFLFKVERRCIRPNSLPAENEHQRVLKLFVTDVKALGVSDFLSQSKLDTRMDLACKAKTEAEKGERKNEG